MPDGRDPRDWAAGDPDAVRAYFDGLGRRVVYFAGYGELGYADPTVVDRTVRAVLRDRTPSSTVVHCGTLLRIGGRDGIAEVYRTARRLGFTTTGIHPSVAWEYPDTHRVSDRCDHVFVVRDRTWGGVGPDGTPSPTLSAHLAVSHEMVLVGGGRHAAQELGAFATAGRPVRYVPADMDVAAAREWCARDGIPELDPGGAVRAMWPSVASLPGVSLLDLTA